LLPRLLFFLSIATRSSHLQGREVWPESSSREGAPPTAEEGPSDDNCWPLLAKSPSTLSAAGIGAIGSPGTSLGPSEAGGNTGWVAPLPIASSGSPDRGRTRASANQVRHPRVEDAGAPLVDRARRRLGEVFVAVDGPGTYAEPAADVPQVGPGQVEAAGMSFHRSTSRSWRLFAASSNFRSWFLGRFGMIGPEPNASSHFFGWVSLASPPYGGRAVSAARTPPTSAPAARCAGSRLWLGFSGSPARPRGL